MPRADVIDLRVLSIPSGWDKERGGRWLTRTIFSCYCTNPEEVSSFVRRICNWKSWKRCIWLTARGAEAPAFLFLRSRKVSGNFFVWRCCWLELCVNTAFSWAQASSVFPIRRRLHYEQSFYRSEEQVKERSRRMRLVIRNERAGTGYVGKGKGWGGSSNVKFCKRHPLLRMPYPRIAHLSEAQADMF